MSRRLAWMAAGCFMALAGGGCGGNNQFPVARVSGKVTLEGKPLPGGGSISFIPTASGEGKAAGGEIKPDGTYMLSTYGTGDGALLGKHRVEVRQNLTLEPAVWPEAPKDGEPPRGLKPTKPEVKVPETDRIPPIYASSSSPLTAEVEKSTSDLNFDLKKK
ncbi:MAG: hypothetical protein IT428_00765 [Planctomycetaceae bacterium]|nr:hypothetical protein [Planctomycetaceae bacterium]